MGRAVFTRQTAARIASAIGILGLLGAILLYLAQRDVTGTVFAAAVVGVAGLSLWLTLAPDDWRTLFTRRRTLYGGNSLLLVALVTGIVLVGYTLASTSNVVADLTEYQLYSLRPDAAALVKSLTQPVIITVFYTTAQLDQQAADQPVLNLFRDASKGLIKISVVDPNEQPVVAHNFGASSQAHAFVTGVTTDGQPDLGKGKIVALNNDHVGEQQIADAILLLQAHGKFKVLFTIGDNEVNTDSNTGGIATQIRGGLEQVGISTGTIDLTTQDIPPGTTALILLSPKTDLTDAETQKIAQYAANGGRILIMAKPLLVQPTNAPVAPLVFQFLQDSSPMTKYLWETWGVRAQNDVVYDPASNVDSPYQPLTAQAAKHPIMARDQAGTTQLQALLYVARSWEVAATGKAPPNVSLTPLILTSSQAFGATDIRTATYTPDNYQRSAKDLPGPLIMAVAAENTLNHSRLVVIGDSDWATDQVVEQYNNALLWSNMMNWLTEYQQKTTVSPVETQLPLVTDTGTLNVVVVLTVLALPGLVLAAGVFVWWDRARR
ncbi:MAG: DUF4350 domain-containing protein [Aggregatilineales bacterium]